MKDIVCLEDFAVKEWNSIFKIFNYDLQALGLRRMNTAKMIDFVGL